MKKKNLKIFYNLFLLEHGQQLVFVDDIVLCASVFCQVRCVQKYGSCPYVTLTNRNVLGNYLKFIINVMQIFVKKILKLLCLGFTLKGILEDIWFVFVSFFLWNFKNFKICTVLRQETIVTRNRVC